MASKINQTSMSAVMLVALFALGVSIAAEVKAAEAKMPDVGNHECKGQPGCKTPEEGKKGKPPLEV